MTTVRVYVGRTLELPLSPVVWPGNTAWISALERACAREHTLARRTANRIEEWSE